MTSTAATKQPPEGKGRRSATSVEAHPWVSPDGRQRLAQMRRREFGDQRASVYWISVAASPRSRRRGMDTVIAG
jgi:hypothetical protein